MIAQRGFLSTDILNSAALRRDEKKRRTGIFLRNARKVGRNYILASTSAHYVAERLQFAMTLWTLARRAGLLVSGYF